MSKMGKNIFALTLITVILGLALGGVYTVTKAPIEAAEKAEKQKACQSVFPEAETFEEVDLQQEGLAEILNSAVSEAGYLNETVEVVYEAYDASGEKTGHVFTVATDKGFGGTIRISMGVDNEGTIQGIYFLTLAETAGLGMNASKPEFKDQFIGMNCEEVKYSKTGKTSPDEIDAISAATITTKAVTGAVNAGLAAHRLLMEGGM